MEKTYKIVRFFENGEREYGKTGLTLEEAQEHCQRDDTSGEIDGVRFFDGYNEE
jgi:hypothetical protein